MSGHGKHVAVAGLIVLAVGWKIAVVSAGGWRFPGIDPNAVMRFDPNVLSQSLLAWQGRHAEEVYRTEGAEIVPWTREAALSSPDNAATLYYQAFLLRPEPDVATYLRINAVLGGADPDRQVRVYLGNCRAMIHTAEVAAQVPGCTWGVRHLDPKGFDQMFLLAQIRQFALVLALDARTLASDGHHQAALARCLTMRRLARHVGDDTMVSYLVALAADSLARSAMQHVLGLAPADVNLLQQVRGQLTAVPGAPASIQKAMQADLNLVIESLRNDSGLFERIRQNLARNAKDQQTRERALTLADEDVLTLAREPYQQFLDRIFQVIDSDMPYEQKYAEIGTQTDGLVRDYGNDPAASCVMRYSFAYTGGIAQRYNLFVRHAAGYNALKTALEVYLARAQTGQLPQALPAYTPKDPFSGQDFEYEITSDGFLLRCRAKDLDADRIWQYDFEVRHSNSPNP